MKKILIVVDMQQDFVTGALGSQEAQAIIPKISIKINQYLENGDAVLFTQDTHTSQYLSTQEGRYLPVEHCIENTQGWEIVPELNQANHSKQELMSYVKKETFGSLEVGRVLERLAEGNTFQVELVGVCTDICVVSNALLLKTMFPENQVIVDAACCAGTSVVKHQQALSVMESCQVTIVNA